jgi:hypothetical protein
MKYLKLKKIMQLLALSLILTSCASTLQYSKVAEANTVDPDKATIYVIRPTVFGSAIKFGIYQDDKLIGRLGPKSYLAWSVDADGNDISIVSKSENKDMLNINPQPGKTYYIRQKVRMGFAVARTAIEFMDESEAKEILEKIKPPKSKYSE